MGSNHVILVVDDERDHADGIAESLEKLPGRAIAVYSGEDALEILRNEHVDIIITDLKLGGDIDGLAVLKEARGKNDHTEVILITAYATIDTCKEAIKEGAYDYLVKPIDIDQLRAVVEQALRKIPEPFGGRRGYAPESKDDFNFQGVRGTNAEMEGVFEVLRRVAPTNLSILIEGESGTGKELLAKSIDNNSRRRSKPFRPVNCAGFTETLLESELFGHVKGAFTGAAGDRKGLFELADKGTLFLDEIGDMPLNMQAKLLRVLEDGIVTPVGSGKNIVVDVRLIRATNHDLTQLMERKKFRQDLYFRIKGVSISIPALRDRREDIGLLIGFFLKEAAAEIGSDVTGITEPAQMILTNYHWLGNVRQLRNCVRTMVVMCEKDKLDLVDIPLEVAQRRQLTDGRAGAGALAGMSLNELEKQAIIDTLTKTGNNREQAAKILGIGERTLYRKIKEYNL